MIELGKYKEFCLSGGAEGADLKWGKEAEKNGIPVFHLTFEGHVTNADPEQLVFLEAYQLLYPAIEKSAYLCNETLKRKYPPRSFHTKKLLMRSVLNSILTESIYGVATFEKYLEGDKRYAYNVKGGTAWAFQSMFVKSQLVENELKAYLFDMKTKHWYKMETGESHIGQLFSRVDSVPTPTGFWAGVGSRKLEKSGNKAIERIWKQ